MPIYSIQVKAHPRRPSGVLSIEPNGTLIVSIGAERIEGKANKLLIAVLADHFHVAPSAVSIVKGHLSSFKVIQVDK